MADNVNVLDVLGRAAGYILCEAGSESDDYLAMHDAIARIAELIAAANRVNKLYPLHWDRTDGAAIIMPDRVPEFEAAFESLNAALSACTGGSNG